MFEYTLNHNLDNVQMTVHMTELIDMFVLHLMFLLYYAIADASKGVICFAIADVMFLPCYAIPDTSKRVLCYAIPDVKFLLAYAIEMTEFIDMFEMTEVIDMFVLCLTFLLCYAIADLKKEREECRREREAASNAA